MSWIAAILLALVAFALVAFAFRVPRGGWTVVLAALVFGLAGYAFQASPAIPSAPKSAQARNIGEAGWQLVAIRQEFVSENRRSGGKAMITADALVRNGRFEDAAKLLAGAVEDNPQDYEAWLALGNALVEHAEGNLTPAALHAYRRATAIAPDEPGPAVFMGFSMVREGRLVEAHQLWSGTLAAAPEGAEWRETLEQRIGLLEQLMRRIVESSRNPAS